MGYRVKAPLVQAKTADGAYVHVYEGGFLPDDPDEEQVKQLLDQDMVEEADAPAEPEEDAAPKRRRRK